jgi:DNA repair ATPase RecN
MSLQHIVLRDFVIVRELDLDLSSGFSALTGETGAGKSILIDALQLVLGARAETSVVREGAARAEICAEFDTTPEIVKWQTSPPMASCCSNARLMHKAKAAHGSTAAPPPPLSCAP